MNDLRTDDGIRDALRAIAAWPPPPENEAGTPPPAVLRTAPAPRPVPARAGHDRRWAIAAAIVVLGLLAAVLVATRGDRTPPARASWLPMAPSPLSPRFAPMSLWMGDRLLVWGGHDAEGEELTDGATYDPATNRWAPIADQPFPYERRAGSPVGAASGWWSTSPTPGAWYEGLAYFVLTSPEVEWGWDLVAYDPATDRWAPVDRARFDQQPNDALVATEGDATVQNPGAMVVHGGQLLVFGWHSQEGEYGWASFDPATGAWGPFQGVPDSGEEYGLGWATPAPVLVADRWWTWVPSQGLEDADRFGFAIDLDTGAVIDLQPPGGQNIQWISGFSADGAAVGGTSGGSLAERNRFTAQLDPASGTWTPLPDLPGGQPLEGDDAWAPTVVTADDRTVVLGGLDPKGGEPRSVHGEVVLDDDRWRSLPDAPIDLARTDPVAVWTGTELLVWGGATGSEGDAIGAEPSIPLADGARLILDR